MLIYKGFIGDVSVCDATGKVFGRVANLDEGDDVTFQGATVADAEREFQKSIDDYLELCYD
jgi:predicted HicB family RNase H-like nuclease